MTSAGPLDTLIELNVKYSKKSKDPIFDVALYRTLVARLIYIMTQMNISFAVQVVSEFMSDLRRLHCSVVFHIICYLHGSLRHGIFS